MARYLQDQNKVALLHESGTYANTSGNGVWLGEVTEHSIEDNEEKIEDRYLGTASRSFGDYQQGPRSVTGTIDYNVQNFRLPFFAIGSTHDATSGANVTHTATQIETSSRQSGFTSGTLNPMFSFTIEDSKQSVGTGRNFVRTARGCIPNSITISASQGEKITASIEYMGQTLIVSSGTTTSLTEDTKKPYLWSSARLTLAGSNIQTAKEVTLELNNNLEGPHYLNGSRDISVPFPNNRETTLSVTLDLDGTDADFMYNNLFKNNNIFNTVLDFNQDSTTGSQHAIFTMSGCYITSFENPSTNEGTTESSIEVAVKDISAIEYTSSSSSVRFNPW